jgi:hypothetical protein
MSTIPGGWTPFSTTISAEEKAVFDKAFQGFVGVQYDPLAVSTQVVSGTNYKFFCNSTVVYPNAPTIPALVIIYTPFQGDPHITEIRRLDF